MRDTHDHSACHSLYWKYVPEVIAEQECPSGHMSELAF